MKRSWFIPLVIILLALVCLICCACLLIAAGMWSFSGLSSSPKIELTLPVIPLPTETSSLQVTLTHTPGGIRPTASPTPLASPNALPVTATPQPTSVESSTPGTPEQETLLTLKNTVVPVNDLIDLAERFEGKQNLPVSLGSPAAIYKVGDQLTFWASNSDTDNNFQVKATLRYVTDHVYFWIENGAFYNKGDLKTLVETFETKIYPTDREFFGSEWTPGVDADPHLFILYARNLGASVAGFFSPVDEYLPVVREDSNGHEMFLINADVQALGAEYTYSVLAHEFQHMIHWYHDPNEETWMNEGFSELAALLNGYDVGGMDQMYVQNPDLQLTDWPDHTSDSDPNYGASFLFLTYFLDRFGEKSTQALVSDPANGMASIDQVLATRGITDPLTGKIISADNVFADWVVTNFLNNPNVGDGRFTYHNYPNAPRPTSTEKINDCPLDPSPRDVYQYGVDYIQINCHGDYTLRFESATQVNILPEGPHSGSYAFYSNVGDTSDMTLTRTFDFTNVSGPLTLSYWTWYNLEKGYDYVYLVASQGNGKTWQIITTPSGTTDNPSGNSYGWGYTGNSGDGSKWIQEKVDLSQFAGQKVQLRFEYVTDATVNGEGFLLDDVSIPAIDYASDFETDDGGWQAQGFVRIANLLSQTFRLELISIGSTTTVQNIQLSADNVAEIPLHLGSDIKRVILVVSGTTRFTRQKATYLFSIH